MTETTGKLAEALAKVQAALPVVHKGKTASIKSDKGSYGYTYADLADVTAAILPLLTKHGLAFTCHPRAVERGGYELAATLMHTSGESITGALPLNGSTPQQLGSSITYMRRYLLGCMTGLVTDDDDDARTATEAAQVSARETRRAAAEAAAPRITDMQSKRMYALLHETGLDQDQTDHATGEVIPARDVKLKMASHFAGRPITSTSELSTTEADRLITHLAERAAKAKAASTAEKEADQ